PLLFPSGLESSAFVSSLDLAPTLAGLFGAGESWSSIFRGRDFSKVLTDDPKLEPREEMLFCFDDLLVDEISAASVPAWLRALRKELDGRDWMYAVYFDALGTSFDYELYDLTADPL